MPWRDSPQPLLPIRKPATPPGAPDIYPSHPIAAGAIELGYAALAEAIAGQPLTLIDGYGGVFWQELRRGLAAAGVRARWIHTADYFKAEADIDAMLAAWLGGDDPLFGKRFPGCLADFFSYFDLPADASHTSGLPTIVFGVGAFLFGEGFRVYVDLPKNEIQYRSRAGSFCNLGARAAANPKAQYKRMYFVDWPALNRHKMAYAGEIDLFVDGQEPARPRLISGDAARASFSQLCRTAFRPRPWFEPGAWGGQWLKATMPGLAQDVPNYAWSFEMIAPEQGIILEDGGTMLELSYDWLQYHDNAAVLGIYAGAFGYEFPIRFDFLDTMGGGNLSLQCHPRPHYIREHFGERFTQDETYYIMAAEPGASVYLGFQAGVDPAEFRGALESSLRDSSPLDVERYARRQPARVGDLFLIPHGTLHCAGAGSLVLEISATPYIFTFKLYDWLRLGLDGLPRPINLERGLANLDFDLQGEAARALVSQPVIIAETPQARIEQLPTHARHFYDIQRLSLRGGVELNTDGSPQLLMAVAGAGITLETPASSAPLCYNIAETVIVPAAAGSFRLSPRGSQTATVIRAYLKADWFQRDENSWLWQVMP